MVPSGSRGIGLAGDFGIRNNRAATDLNLADAALRLQMPERSQGKSRRGHGHDKKSTHAIPPLGCAAA